MKTPMGSRNNSPDRCKDCQLRKDLCICEFIPSIDLKTKIIVLIHHQETKRTSNTGKLAHMVLKNSELRVRGLKDNPMDTVGLLSPERQAVLLFPTDDAIDLTSEFIQQFDKPLTLIVPDGNWRQASRMPNRVVQLANLPRVKVPLTKPTEYRLRNEPRTEGLATFEAIARALGIIEGPEVQEKMEFIFKMKVERTLNSRGMSHA